MPLLLTQKHCGLFTNGSDGSKLYRLCDLHHGGLLALLEPDLAVLNGRGTQYRIRRRHLGVHSLACRWWWFDPWQRWTEGTSIEDNARTKSTCVFRFSGLNFIFC